MDRKLPAIVIRTLVRVYEDQYAWVCWGKAKSSRFSIVNGTRQGSVLSPALFAVYVDDLLKAKSEEFAKKQQPDVFNRPCPKQK